MRELGHSAVESLLQMDGSAGRQVHRYSKILRGKFKQFVFVDKFQVLLKGVSLKVKIFRG